MPERRNCLHKTFLYLFLAGLMLFVPITGYAPAAASDFPPTPLRVGITLQDSFLRLSFTGSHRLVDPGNDMAMDIPPGDYTFLSAGSGIEVRGDEEGRCALGGTFYLEPLCFPDDSFFEIKNASYGGKYRGGLEITRPGGSHGIVAVNIIDLEMYLRGVIAREMPASWGNYGGEEALKAQAVAARTYALYQQTQQRHSGYHLCDCQHCQVYGGMDAELPQTDLAARETAGEILTYGGRIIEPVYHATNGGFTEQAENVWGWSFPYFRAEPDPFDDPRNPLGLSNMVTHATANWVVEVPSAQLPDLLVARGMANPGRIEHITIASSFPSGRVCELLLVGDRGNTVSLFKEQVSAVLGADKVKSLLFNVREKAEPSVWIASCAGGNIKKESYAELEGRWVAAESGPLRMLLGDCFSARGTAGGSSFVPYASFIFEGRGSGHGVGMSQNGAYNRSRQGHGYKEILSFYYPGTEINSGY